MSRALNHTTAPKRNLWSTTSFHSTERAKDVLPISPAAVEGNNFHVAHEAELP